MSAKKIEIAIKGLNDDERVELEATLGVVSGVGVSDYIEKGFGLEEVVKIFFTNFHVLEWARDAILWELFKTVVLNTRDFIQAKKPDVKRQWVVRFENVTIIVPDDLDDMQEMLLQLPYFLQAFPSEAGITTVTFDTKNKTVEVRVMRF